MMNENMTKLNDIILHIFWGPSGRPWTSIWELVPCHCQHLLFSNKCSSKECSLEQALILCGPIRSLPCLMFPGSTKVLTNDRWPNVETTADNKSTLDEIKNKTYPNMGMQWKQQKASWLKCRRRDKRKNKQSQRRLEQSQLKKRSDLKKTERLQITLLYITIKLL